MAISFKLNKYHFILIGIIVFALDILKPLEYNDWIIYCFLLGFASKYNKRKDLYILALVYTAFIVTAFFQSQNYETQAVQTHIRGTIMLWFLTYLLGKLKSEYYKEEKLRTEQEVIFDRIDEIIFGLDKDYRLIYKNSTSDKRGYSFVQIGDNFFEKMPRLIGTDLEINLKKAMSTQKPMTFIYQTKYTPNPRTVISSVYPSEDGLSVYTKDITEITEAQVKIEEANERIHSILSRIEDAFWAVDYNFNVVYANEKMIKWVGKNADEIIGKNLWEVLPVLRGTIVEQKLKESMETQQNIKFEMKSIIIPDTYFNVSINASKEGLTIYAQDISQYKETKIELQLALEDRSMMFQELNHRIKNNLQIISSMMNLKLGEIKDPEAKSVLEDILKRIQSISLVHSKLYEADSLFKLDLSNYIREVVDYLVISYERSNVTVKMDLSDVSIDVKYATPVGMMISELVSNSIKYACREGECIIVVACKQENGFVRLIIKDNGNGYPEKVEDKQTLGMLLVKHLAEQLDAKIIMENRDGAYTEIFFPHIE